MAIYGKSLCYLAFFADMFCRLRENVYLCATKNK